MKTKYNITVYEDEKCIVRIHKPILTKEEYRKRELAARKALVEFGRELFRNKGECR